MDLEFIEIQSVINDVCIGEQVKKKSSNRRRNTQLTLFQNQQQKNGKEKMKKNSYHFYYSIIKRKKISLNRKAQINCRGNGIIIKTISWQK